MTAHSKRPTISVVMPVYNETSNIPELYRRLTAVMAQLAEPYELVFVDDGSFDDSVEKIKELRENDIAVKLVRLSRNFGHQKALQAGLSVARGLAVVTMDSDLQDAPEVIPEFVARWREGYSVVFAIRRTRKEHFLKQWCYKSFYRLLNWLSETPLPIDSGDFALMDRKITDLLNSLPERTRFLRGLRAWVGYKQIGVPIDRDARFSGTPKYSLRQLFTLASSGIISFSLMPLRIASALGLLVSCLSFISIALVLYFRLFTHLSIPGFASTASMLLFLSGVQLLTIGVLGEYVGKIYEEVKNRPIFLIAEKLGLEDDSG
jgi:dolichol-phosphate mannosyltransferase